MHNKGISQQTKTKVPPQWQTHQDPLTTINSVKKIEIFCNPKQQTRNGTINQKYQKKKKGEQQT